jgi:hypothetical protein
LARNKERLTAIYRRHHLKAFLAQIALEQNAQSFLIIDDQYLLCHNLTSTSTNLPTNLLGSNSYWVHLLL